MFLFFRSRDNLCLAVGRISYALNTRRFKLRRYDADNTKYLMTYEISWQIGLDRAFLGFLGQNLFIGFMTGFAGIVYKHIRIGIFWLK